MINKFIGEYYFLSNNYETTVEFDGITYHSSEAAYHAQKTLDMEERASFAKLSADEAKNKGRSVKLREDWEIVRFDTMYRVCRAKFAQNPVIAQRLLDTGIEELVDGNDHGDTYWGRVDGKGENYLGKLLMRIRTELAEDAPEKLAERIAEWIRIYFENNANPQTKAIIGISGGKDSSVAAALCVKALGKDRVVGVLMPQGEQPDIDCSRMLVDFLGIENYTINIGDAVSALTAEISDKLTFTEQAKINTPSRIRMTTLYAVAACIGGRVVNTCNLSEDWVGYSTKFGDSAGDFSPLSDLTVTEILQVGDALGLPYELVHKVPIDGLCGKSDEENLGFTYAQLDRYIKCEETLEDNPKLKERIDTLHKNNLHKLLPMPKFTKI